MRTRLKATLFAAAAVLWAGAAHAAGVTVADYGVTKDGKAVKAYTLTNDKGASATVLDYGGAVAAIRVPDRRGHMDNVVMTYNDMTGWETMHHVNSLIGRYANRINNGFTLDGAYYPLTQTRGVTMHGGVDFYAARVLSVEPIRKADGAAVTMDLDSPDGDQGFPGHVRVKLRYAFSDDDTLRIDFEATTDKDTVINLTNHIYFNLKGNGTVPVYGERLQINADRTPAWAEGADKDRLDPVAGTLTDWRKPTLIGDRLAAVAAALPPANPQQAAALPPGAIRTFNLSLMFPQGANTLDHVAARMTDADNGRVVEVRTTEPSIQAYVPATEPAGLLTEGGKPFTVGPAMALETQHLPDSPNHPGFPSTVLKPGQTFRSTTTFTFSVAG